MSKSGLALPVNDTASDVFLDCSNFRNNSDDPDFDSSAYQFIEFVCYPLLLLFCTCGNLLSLAVFGSRLTASSVSVYLTSVALSDLGVLWFYLHIYATDVKLYQHQDEASTYREAALRTRVFDWLRDTCIQISDWSLIAFSVERLIVISFPLKFKNGFQWKTGALIETMIAICAALFSLEGLVTPYYYIAIRPSYPNGSAMEDIVGDAIIRWHTMQNEAEVAMTVLKWVLLTCCNISLVVLLQNHFASKPGSSAGPHAREQRTFSKSNVILLGAITLYLLTNAPVVVLKCLVRASKPPYCTFFLTDALQQQFSPIANIFLLANYSLNFVTYCVSRRFRASFLETKQQLSQWTMRKIFEKWKSDPQRKENDSSTELQLTPVATESELLTNTQRGHRC